MKKTYVRPRMVGETFVANEYFAACDKLENSMYKFVCDAGNGAYGGDLYLDNNGDGKFTNGEQLKGGFHRCGETHFSPTTDVYQKGYQVNAGGGGAGDVLVWIDQNGNHHATTKLDMTKWETTKS